ncbi:MAG: TonB-dependent receptor [Lentimicrobiaceae bacterium]|jgi:iron complex outermembrane receptor protein|nr:TonB-dependent receptor [Lentimicrobiaceae bacterium]MDD4596517.1 TonB-dependent receptor [Lentimicrobiaceae bacterium]MDY0024759.1 TonB-dependent receptor [Lentimicrobium sp.]
MKLRMLPAMLVLLPFFTVAQITLKGKVVDEQTLTPLQGAHLNLNNRLVHITTDEKGMFEINGLKAGNYQIKVSYMGYQVWESLVDLSADKVMLISMERSAIMSDATIITATRANEKTPVTYQDLNAEEISRKNQGRDIPYLLEQMPGLVVSSDAGNGLGLTSFRIRGTDMNRINITVNGIPLNDAESHGVFFVNMPDFASSLGSLQVQRGVGTSTNGAAAFGASVNLQTTPPPSEPYGSITNAYGSFNTWKHSIETGTGLINGKWALDARLSKLSSDGYIDRATADLKSLYVSGGFYGKNTIARLNIISGIQTTYQAWDGVPSNILDTNRTYNGIGKYIDYRGNIKFYDNETDNYQQDHYQLQISQRLSDRLTGNFALHYTRGIGYYEQYKDDARLTKYLINPVLLPGNDSVLISRSDLIRRKNLDNHFYGFTWSVNYDLDKLLLMAGGSGNQYEGLHFGNVIWAEFAQTAGYNHRWYENTGKKQDLNVYLKAQYQAGERLNLYADFQLRGINYKLSGIDDDLRDISQTHEFLFFNPKAGLFYQLNSHNSFYFSFAIANREPNRSNYTDADPDKVMPQAETLQDYELGYHYNRDKFTASVNAYYMYYRDQLVLTGAINDVGKGIMTNVPESFRTGLEFTGAVTITSILRASANFTLSRNEIIKFTEFVDDWDNWGTQIENPIGNTNLSFSPNATAGAEIGLNLTRAIEAYINGKYVARQYIDNTSSVERSLDPYFVTNFRLSWMLRPDFIRGLEMNLNINNLLNAEYETNAWVYRYYSEGSFEKEDGYFPQAGINFMAGLTVKL